MIALTTTSIAWLLFTIILAGWVVYAFLNLRQARDELGSEIEMAANRKPYYDDDILEGPRLTRVLGIGVILLVVIVIAMPLYWILEPSRQAGAVDAKEEQFIEWGAELFAPTAEGGFNCAGCHGANGGGGSAAYNITDPVTQQTTPVNWTAPALNTVFYRFDEEEIRFILVYGRPFSPMSPWGVEGGGPMNDQQIETLISYLRSIQIPREDCAEGEDPLTCSTGHLPAATQADIDTRAHQLMDDNGWTYGEALFNLDLAGGGFSCARCHTPGWSWGDPGEPGSGGLGWNLTGGAVNEHFPLEQDMYDFVANGSVLGAKYGIQGQGSGRMPGFGSLLTEEQLQAVVEYVRSL